MLGELNRVGYICLIIVPLVVLFAILCWRPKRVLCGVFDRDSLLRSYARHSCKRQRGFRLFRSIFVCLCIISLVGGVINSPFGWDAYAYRIPRVLRWLQEERWTWLMAGDSRMDISSVAQEWQMAPLISLFGTDRLIFLTNFIPYCLFPGLIYLAARSIGVKRYWSLVAMWMIPLGYCFSLSSAGVQNDGVGGIHAAAALAFLHPTCQRYLTKHGCLALSLVQIALITGLKLSSLPIAGIVFLYVVWRYRTSIPCLCRRPLFLLPTLVVCAVCSIIPISCINYYYEGAISGDAFNAYTCEAENPAAACVVNLGFFAVDAITPNPLSGKCNEWSSKLLSGSDFSRWCLEEYPLSRTIRFATLAYEGAAGPGFPLLVGFPLIYLFAWRRKMFSAIQWTNGVFFALCMVAFVVYLSKLASNASPRISAPYIPVIILALLSMISGFLRIRTRLNTLVFGICSLLVMISIVAMSSRPIMPQYITNLVDPHANHSYSHQRFASRDAGKFLASTEDTIYYVSDWGAITHRLFAPFRSKGKSIEVGSVEWNQHRPSGRQLFAFTTLGVENRFGMRVEKFLELVGPARLVGTDTNVPIYAKDNQIYLYELSDISKIPKPLYQRTYHNHRNQIKK